MSPEEQNATIARLIREHKEIVEKRLYATERVKQIATALERLARAINRKPDFEEVSKDSILHEYLDLSRMGALVIEEHELAEKQQDYEARLRSFGLEPWSRGGL
jgi:hypothetical protein